jgi:hypothetical protein
MQSKGCVSSRQEAGPKKRTSCRPEQQRLFDSDFAPHHTIPSSTPSPNHPEAPAQQVASSLTENSHLEEFRHVRLAGIPLSARLITASRRHHTTGPIVSRGFWNVSHSAAPPRSNSNRAAIIPQRKPSPEPKLFPFAAAPSQGEDTGSS